MIDVNKELKRMSEEFGIPEKEVAVNFRSIVRSGWGDSIFKKDFYSKRGKRIKNENPRSMKRFPTVVKYQCNICKGLFSAVETELDHLDGENSMTDLSHAESFIKTILFTSPDKLQILCKDKKKKVKGKSVIVSFGCHSLLTYSERYNVTFEQARKAKEFINASKDINIVIDLLTQYGVQSIPKTKKDKLSMLKQFMIGDNHEI